MYYGAGDVRIEEIEERHPGPDEVRIDVSAAGICGTDLQEYAVGPIAIPADEPHPVTGETLPLPMGHEFAGTVAEVGEAASALQPGDAVTVNPLIWCGECRHCRAGRYEFCEAGGFLGLSGNGGGFAESVTVPAITAVPLPDELATHLGALVEPLSVGLYAVRDAEMAVGDSVAVFGAGPIGLSVVQAARAAGAGKVVVSEPIDGRRELARRAGADVVLDPGEADVAAQVHAETDGGTDTAFEAAGVEATFDAALASTRPAGETTVVSHFEEPVDLHPVDLLVTRKAVTASLAYPGGPVSRESFGRTVDLIAAGQLDPAAIVTDRIDLADIVPEGFERLTDPGEHAKILVEP